MQIGPGISQIDMLPRVIAPLYGAILLHGVVTSSLVARSNAEPEFRALAQGLCEGTQINRVLSMLGKDYSLPIQMMCDNQAAISIAKNPVHPDRTKHVEIDRNFISEKVDQVVHLNYVPTKQQIVDILTKPSPRPNFEDLNSKLGLYNIYYPP